MSTSRSKPSDLLDGTRILLARMSRGLTRAELARRLAVSARTVQRFEQDGAPTEQATLLARGLGYPAQFFSRPPLPSLDEEQVRFRARRRASVAQRAAARADGAIGVEMYEWVARSFALPAVQVPDLDGRPPEAGAAALRGAWGQGVDPLPNLIQLAEANGVRVLGLPPGSRLVDAFSLWKDGRPYVFLSLAKTAERSRFDLAHELGHLVLHSRGHADDARAEREADRFAAAFLMPAESVLPRAGRETSIRDVLELRAFYCVSALAMAHRLHELGRSSDWAYRQACVHLAQRGYRDGEPGGMPREQSRVFGVTLAALRARGIDTAGIAHELAINEHLVHDLTLGQAWVVAEPANSASDDAGPPERPPGAASPALRLVRSAGAR